jgi:hypothetical protein
LFGLSGLLAGLAVMTHQLAGLQAVVVVSIISGLVLVVEPRRWLLRLKQWSILAFAFAVVVLPGVPVYIDLLTRAGPAAFNAQGTSSLEAMLDYLTYDSPLLWAVVALCVPLALILRIVGRSWLVVATLVALLVASVGLTLLTFEVRAMFLGLFVGFLSTVVLFADLIARSRRQWQIALGATACAFWLGLAASGQQRFDSTVRYYTTLDPFVVAGLQWLQQRARPGDLAVSVGPHEKWPLGWWVQGLARVPSYLAYDSRWLYFREEKEQAQIAHTIVEIADPQRAAEQAQRYGVTLLVFDTRDASQADVWLHSGRVFGPIGLVYSNPSLAIFRVDRPPRPPSG